MKTAVCFRKTKWGIEAIFPYELFTNEPTMACYAHVGQHSSACPMWVYTETKPAKPEEYQDLKNELENVIGYDLEVLDRLPSYGKAIKTLIEKRGA